MGGVIQGITQIRQVGINNNYIRYILHPAIQKFVVHHWLQHINTKLLKPKMLQNFQDNEWIKINSGGTYQDNLDINKIFSL